MVVVGSGKANATTITIPAGHQTGDLILIFAFRDGSTTGPTIPGTFTQIDKQGANTCSGSFGYRIATSGAETSGTWTNATDLVVLVLRGQAALPIGDHQTGGAASTTVNYPALTMQVSDGSSWVIGVAGHRSVDTTIETAPTGMANRQDQLDATAETVLHDTNGGASSWSSQNVSVGGTSSGWRSFTLEVKALLPSITVNTTDNTETTDTTPLLEFTGTEATAKDLEYEIQIDTSSSFNSQAGSPLLDKVTTTDTGFADETNGADTHPFASGDKIGFTVQAGDALGLGTYYYRIRAKAPSGDNVYGAWSTTQEVHIYQSDRQASEASVSSIPTDANHPYSSGAVALSSTKYSNIDTDDTTREAQVGGDITYPYFLQKKQLTAGAGFKVNFNGQINKTTATENIVLQKKTAVNASYGIGNVANVTFDAGASAPNRILIVNLAVNNGTGFTISAITYNGVTLSPRSVKANGTNALIRTYYLVAPATGSNTFSITASASSATVISLAVYSGVDQSTIFDVADATFSGTIVKSNGTSSNAIVTSTDGAEAISAFSEEPAAGITIVANNSQVIEASSSSLNALGILGDQLVSSHGSTTMGWKNTSVLSDAIYAEALSALLPNINTLSIKVDLWNFNTSAWDNQDTNTTVAVNTDYTVTVDKTSGFANYVDGSGWIYARVYAQYGPTVTLSVDLFTITSGSSTATKTFTVDGLITERFTFTVDGIVKVTSTATFTVDGIVKATSTDTFTVDAIILVTSTKTYTVDAIVLVTTTKTFTIDAVVLATSTKTFTVDGIVKVTSVATFTIDAIVKSSSTATFTVDAVILVISTKTFTVDGVILVISSKTFTVDGIVLQTQTQTFTVDAVIKASQSFTFIVDGIVQVSQTKTFTVDAIVLVTFTFTFTVDGIVLVTQNQTFIVDAIIQVVTVQTFTVDGVVLVIAIQTFTVDGIVLETKTSTFTVDAVVSTIPQFAFTVDGIILGTNTFTFTVDGIVKIVNTQTFTVDAVLLATTDETFTVDAVINAFSSVTFTVDAVVLVTNTKTFTVDGIVLQIQTKTFTVDALILVSTTATYTVDAIVQASQNKTFTVDGIILVATNVTYTVDAIILVVVLNTFIVDAVIFATNTKTFTVDAQISGATLVTFTIDAIVLATLTVTFTVDALINQSSSTTFTVDAVLTDGSYYTREETLSLPVNDVDLTTNYSSSDYTDVSSSNDVRVAQEGSLNEFVLHQFKKHSNSNANGISVSVELQVKFAPTRSTVYLQIYNQVTTTWETLDSNNTVGAQVDFILSGRISTNLSNYYTNGNWVSFRVYQEVI